MGDTCQSEEAWIVIGRPQPCAIGGTTRLSEFHRTVAIVRDLGDAQSLLVRPISITRTADLHRETITIGRLVEDSNRDRGARDRGIVIVHLTGAHRTVQTYRRRTPRSRSDRTVIAVRSSRDHGTFVAESLPQD